MDKWEKLKLLIQADLAYKTHYSFERPVEHDKLYRVLEWMKELENTALREEKISDALKVINETHGETLKRLADTPKGFLFTDVPEFDKATWKKMLENLEGLS